MKAFFPGSFNPFTIGHLDILARAKRLFANIVVGIGYNEHKSSFEDVNQRLESLKSLLADIPGIEIMAYSGLTSEAAAKSDANVIIRGYRNAEDADYEKVLADTNRSLFNIETILLPCNPEMSFVSSSMVRELQHFGVDASRFIPTREECKKLLINN